MKIKKKISLQLIIEFWLIFSRFSARFWPILHPSWSEKGHEPSRGELKILQFDLWLEPAWLGLITTICVTYAGSLIDVSPSFRCSVVWKLCFLTDLFNFWVSLALFGKNIGQKFHWCYSTEPEGTPDFHNLIFLWTLTTCTNDIQSVM